MRHTSSARRKSMPSGTVLPCGTCSDNGRNCGTEVRADGDNKRPAIPCVTLRSLAVNSFPFGRFTNILSLSKRNSIYILVAHIAYSATMPSMWWPHFVSLLSRSWGNLVRATSTNTLGFILWTVALTLVSWTATLAGTWFQYKGENAERPLQKAIRSSLWPSVFEAVGICALVLCAWSIFIAKTIYDDHRSQVSSNAQLMRENLELAAKLK